MDAVELLMLAGVLLAIAVGGFAHIPQPPLYRKPSWPRYLLMTAFVIAGLSIMSLVR